MKVFATMPIFSDRIRRFLTKFFRIAVFTEFSAACFEWNHLSEFVNIFIINNLFSNTYIVNIFLSIILYFLV